MEKLSDTLNKQYKNVDGKNKLKGVLFTNLISNTNNIIDKVNTTKKNIDDKI